MSVLEGDVPLNVIINHKGEIGLQLGEIVMAIAPDAAEALALALLKASKSRFYPIYAFKPEPERL